jgi:hypothetical protein
MLNLTPEKAIMSQSLLFYWQLATGNWQLATDN